MVDDNLIHDALLGYAAVVAANICNELIAILFNGLKPIGNREGHIEFLQRPHVGHKVHSHDFG